MKNLIFGLLILFANITTAQVPPVIEERNIDTSHPDHKKMDVAIPHISVPFDEENHVYSSPLLDNRPEFPGGIELFHKTFNQHYKSPDATLKGKIFLSFIVEKDGTVTDIKVLRDLGGESGEEAVRVINQMGPWKPGAIGGKNVRSLHVIRVIIGDTEP